MKVRTRGYNLYNKHESKLGEAGTPGYDKIPSKTTINIYLITQAHADLPHAILFSHLQVCTTNHIIY
jgi:hypothetical protein